MKAIVTGGAGFVGSHLVDELVSKGYEVHVIDNLSTGKVENLHANVHSHIVDIRTKEATEIIKQIKPDLVFHLAAQADVTTSISNTVEDANININGTINILDASKEVGVKKFIFASTSAVYGDLQKDLITEQDVTSPISFYGQSKLSAENYIKLYSKYYQLPFTILRYGNVYGPRQVAKGEGGVIAIYIDGLKKNNQLKVYGDGEQTRDFIHVYDVVRANINAIESGNQEIIHVSTGQRTSINRIISILSKIEGSEICPVYVSARPGDIKHSCLSNEKAKRLLNLSPLYSIEEGLRQTYLHETS
nr:NAD-dependent epimerase/dehydratase family protein [Lysinibacillus timonensis]